MYLKDIPELSNYEIGDWSYCSNDFNVLTWGEGAKIKIGKFCSIADHVSIFLGGEHRTDWVTTFPFNILFSEAAHILGHPKTKGDVIIGNDVWIGSHVTILSGVHVGNGAVIGTGSVVTQNVPPYAIIGGNPAKCIRCRFSPEDVHQLQQIAWWNWDIEKIIDYLPLLLSKDVERFIASAMSFS
ncbi:MAG: CatB-related O-acetyltransferase [Eubacteriales bacterium]